MNSEQSSSVFDPPNGSNEERRKELESNGMADRAAVRSNILIEQKRQRISTMQRSRITGTFKARITGHSENWAPIKTGRVVQELVSPHTNDSLKTGRLTNRHFLHIIYCFVPLSVFLRYLSSPHMADAQMPPIKKAKNAC